MTPTRSIRAGKAKGLTLLDRQDHRQASAKSAELFQQVIDTDPSFAPAYAGPGMPTRRCRTTGSVSVSRPLRRIPSCGRRPSKLFSSIPCWPSTRSHGLRTRANSIGRGGPIVPARDRSQPKSHPELHAVCSRTTLCRSESWTRRSGCCSRRWSRPAVARCATGNRVGADPHRTVWRGHRYPPADSGSRPQFSLDRLAPRESPDLRGQTSGSVSRV